MVFVTPMGIKLIHHHKVERMVFLHTTDKTLTKDFNQCPICHFEFVNFISTNSEKSWSDYQNFILLLSSGLTSELLNTPLQFYSNRAPPPAIS